MEKLNEKLTRLLEDSKEKGFTSEAEVLKLLDDPNDFEDVKEFFDDANVSIYSDDEMEEISLDGELEGEDEEEEDFPGNIEIEEVQLIELDSIVNSVRTDDPVRMYLKDIGNIPLLDIETETELANTVVKGREAIEKINDFENGLIDLTDREEEKYRKLAEDANYAKNKLVDSNLRLVVSIAKRYTGRNLPFLDLIQEGNMGLMKAVDKFEPDKGYKFSTYATWWVRQAITRAVADQARTIRIQYIWLKQLISY